jgi:glycosylphosphatidylinositol transamidase
MNEVDLYKASFENMILMMARQATGIPDSLHGFFLRHHIEALTLQGVTTKRNAKQNSLRMTRYNCRYFRSFLLARLKTFSLFRIVEGTLRSINNLLERFHQSFFLYLLPNEHSYISIGMYMPPLGCLLLPLVVQVISLWLQMFQSQIENVNVSL